MTTSNVERMRELEKAAPAAPWFWKQSYEMGDREMHWAINNPESDAAKSTIDVRSVTLVSSEWGNLGNVDFLESPYCKLAIAARNSLPALLEIARHATDLVNSCDHCGGTKDDQWPCVKCSELKQALAAFNSLKIDGL